MVVKKKSKVTKTLIAASFFLTIIAIFTPVLAVGSNRVLFMAKGDDVDIAGATTSIIAKIEFDKASGARLAQVEFQTKIYDQSGEKIYSMKGKLKDALVLSESARFYCEVRNVTWANLLYIEGMGILKTTDANPVIEYRGQTIILPNTGGKYIPFFMIMMINPKGEYFKGEDPEVHPEVHLWPQGGWATVIIAPIVGVCSYLVLTKSMGKVVS